ncbi:hypothetical protein KQI52_08730 [bacterium]|nr:hypothetical protein [bacterium]
MPKSKGNPNDFMTYNSGFFATSDVAGICKVDPKTLETAVREGKVSPSKIQVRGDSSPRLLWHPDKVEEIKQLIAEKKIEDLSSKYQEFDLHSYLKLVNGNKDNSDGESVAA